MKNLTHQLRLLLRDLMKFNTKLLIFWINILHLQFIHFETGKGIFVATLYRKRGRMAKRFVHSGMAGITALGVMIAPILADQLGTQGVDPWDSPSPSAVLSATTEDQSMATDLSDKQYRDRTIDYVVQDGDTTSSIAQKFDISVDTIRWQNDLKSKDAIKLGQTLQILPVTGVSHKVVKGDTVYSIAKKYDADAQAIVNFPFNTFVNDETFELAVGQTIIVPEGVKKDEIPWSPVARVKQSTPDAGTVTASGAFAWPTQGTITQRFYWYHKGIDIANRASPTVVAADSGKVITSGWSGVGYGNHVVIDHGNGYRTLYAHMQRLFVVPGQTVARGAALGQMGSTGRSTGIHLHFEIIKGGAYLNPLGILK